MCSAAMRRSAAFLLSPCDARGCRCSSHLSSFDQIAIEGPSVGPTVQGNLGLGNGRETL